jgi:hypothetical protein
LERKEIKILPLFSGYRKEENKKIILTTSYKKMYEEIGKAIYKQDYLFYKILPYKEIISSNLFDIELFAEFQKKNKKK